MNLHIKFILILLACSGPAAAQLTPLQYTNAAAIYTQDFDGLPATGSFPITGKGPIGLSSPPVNANNMAGWQIWMPAGTNTSAVFAPGTGSATGNGIYCLGSTGSSDRALGSLSSSTGIYAFGLVITNTTGMALNNCTISFTTEQWRRGGSGNRNTWSFRYKTGMFSSIDQSGCNTEPALDMVSVSTTGSGSSLNGNLSDNRQQLSFTLQHINWKNGEQLLLRWDDADEAGSDDVCALDNFSFKAWQNAAAPVAIALPAASITSSSAALSGTVDEQFSTTHVYFEYDTTALFTHPQSIAASPDSMLQGAGTVAVNTSIDALLTGIGYYARIRATNTIGTSYSNTIQFTTAFGLPVVATATPLNISAGSAVLGGTISHTGGLPITDQGVIWSVTNTGTGTQLSMQAGFSVFSGTASTLPSGSTIYAKAYASNSLGTAYGPVVSFTTATVVQSLVATDALLNNAGSVHYILTTAQNISGLSAANFLLSSDGISGAAITAVTGSENHFTITVASGTGDGTISLQLINDNNLSLLVYNKPFSATAYRIDKSPPIINTVSIPNKSIKLGDTVPVGIFVRADTAAYKLQSGKINNISLINFSRKNDSMYTATFITGSSTQNIPAENPISVNIVLTDAAGNSNAAYQSPIIQPADAIDVIKPFITAVKLPADSLYKMGDTLGFILRFNEKLAVTNLSSPGGFSATIGSRTKLMNFSGDNGTDSLVFRYIIPNGDADNDGIRINSPLPLLNMEIKDLVGNTANLSYSFPSTKNILVDAVAPTISSITTPPPAAYRTGNLLDFLVNFTEKIWTGESPPLLGLIIGNNERQAMYSSGSGSTSLLFRYEVAADDMDKDGIKLLTPLFSTTAIRDLAGNPSSLSLSNIGALGNVLVNPPTIAVTRVVAPADGMYRLGDTLEFELHFNENAFVDTKNGSPSLRITIGNTTRQAFYTEGSGSNTLLFRYTIQKNELDTDGIRISSTIALNNGTISDEKANPIPPTLNVVGSTANVLVDAADPYVKNVITPAKNTYAIGDTLRFIVNFSENVFLGQTDSVSISITIGTNRRTAAYNSGNSSNGFQFSYIIGEGDLDKNGIRMDSMINIRQGGITDKAGNKLIPQLENIGALSGIRIDGIKPSFVEKTSQLTVCENGAELSISDLLSVIDPENDETLNWQLFETGKSIVSKQNFTGNSNGKTITPASVYYRPKPDARGIDSLVVQVTDGVYTAQKIIQVFILPAISHNETGGSQLVCAGNIPNIIPGTVPMGGDEKYSYQWETATGNEATNFSKASGVDNMPYYAPAKLNTSTWFRRKVFSGACQHVSSPTQIVVVKSGLWTGDYSSNWNNPNNWCTNVIPDQTTDVLVNAGSSFSPEIADSASVNQLQLQGNATLKITGQLKLKKNIRNNGGLINASNGMIILNGNEPQTLPAEVFENDLIKHLVIANTTSVELTGPLTVNGSVVLNSGSLITHHFLKIKTGAFIGPSASGTYISGTISMEKSIHPSGKAFRLIGHPFKNSIALSMIADSIVITGKDGAINGFANSSSNASSAFLFDTAGSSDPLHFDTAWIPFTHTNGIGENAWLEFAGIRLQMDDSATLLFSGEPHTGNQEIRLPQTNGRSFHVLGNPYPAPVDLTRLSKTHGTGDHYWVWTPEQGRHGAYTSIPFSAPHILNPFDVFIVRSDGNTNSLLFTENSKTNNYAKDSLPPLHSDAGYFIELRLEDDSIFWDRILLIGADTSSSYLDAADAEKIGNMDLNFYSISRDKQPLSIDTRPITNTSIIPLGIKTALQQNFRITVAALNLPPDNALMLHDKWLAKWMKLEKDSMYRFSIGSDTSSSGDQRFELSDFKPKTDTGVLPDLFMRITPVPAHETLQLSFHSPEKGPVQIRLLSQAGLPLRQIDLGMQRDGQHRLLLAGLSPGVYFIELRCGAYSSVQKLIKQ